jgi:hypothetical protein
MIAADESLHLHILAREVVDRIVTCLLDSNDIAAVGDLFAVEDDLHALRLARQIDVVFRMLPVPWAAVS